METRSLDGAIAMLKRQRGQGMVEYAFVLVLIAMVVLAMLITTGNQVISLFSNVTATLRSAGL